MYMQLETMYCSENWFHVQAFLGGYSSHHTHFMYDLVLGYILHYLPFYTGQDVLTSQSGERWIINKLRIKKALHSIFHMPFIAFTPTKVYSSPALVEWSSTKWPLQGAVQSHTSGCASLVWSRAIYQCGFLHGVFRSKLRLFSHGMF